MSPCGNSSITSEIAHILSRIPPFSIEHPASISTRADSHIITGHNLHMDCRFSFFQGVKSPLNNFYKCDMRIDGFIWPTVEHYFHYAKAG